MFFLMQYAFYFSPFGHVIYVYNTENYSVTQNNCFEWYSKKINEK